MILLTGVIGMKWNFVQVRRENRRRKWWLRLLFIPMAVILFMMGEYAGAVVFVGLVFAVFLF